MYRLILIAALAWSLPAAPQTAAQNEAREVTVVVGKSLILDSPANLERISLADPSLAETVVANPKEIILNGKAVGETSLILWQQGGKRLVFDLKVVARVNRLEAIQGELAKELPNQDVSVTMQGTDVLLRGTVDNQTSAGRAMLIAKLLGNPVNLLHINVPPVEPQILMKVRFADVDRGATTELGANIVSLGALNTIGSTSTGTFAPPVFAGGATAGGTTPARFTFTDVLNIFLFRPDLNLATLIKALEGRRMLQILAEPNVLAINGKTASFLAGGEFPYPTLQGGGGGLGAVTISFREFGIRINFTPNITPRGTLRLNITPEVSSLDYANGLTFQGFTIPGLATRRVSTEIELESGQSFAIGGLLDNRLTESFSKIKGLGDIPILGRIFQAKIVNKSNSELVVIVTPEIVRPIPEGAPLPDVHFPKEFMPAGRIDPPRTPPLSVTGPVPVKPARLSIPHEELEQIEKQTPSTPGGAPPLIQFMMPAAPSPQAAPTAPIAAPPPNAPAPPKN